MMPQKRLDRLQVRGSVRQGSIPQYPVIALHR